jgi:hypothetical protein
MGLLDWLDPTRHWPLVAGPAPDLDGSNLQFETLRFGDPLESARFLGRPNELQWRSRIERDCHLVYVEKGLRLRFINERLREVTFLVGPGASEHPSYASARPLAPDGTRLTSETDRRQIVALFGEPDPGGSDDTCMQVFHGQGVISDFYLDDDGRLKEWVLYPDD